MSATVAAGDLHPPLSVPLVGEGVDPQAASTVSGADTEQGQGVTQGDYGGVEVSGGWLENSAIRVERSTGVTVTAETLPVRLESVGQKPMRVYDCRHAAATTWLRAGMPLGETARRLGHSVETLVPTYVGTLDDEEQVGNQRIGSILG